MKMCGSGDLAPPFLTSILDGGEWSASRPSRFSPREGNFDIYWIGDWLDYRAVLNDEEYKKNLFPLLN
jgi:hypothetical protein